MGDVTIDSMEVKEANPFEVAAPSTAPKAEKSPDEKMVEVLKPFTFLNYSNGNLNVNHDEMKAILALKRLKMGDLVRRGSILTNLNGGAVVSDEQTATLNGMLASIQVGFENLKADTLEITDTQLILGLFVAVNSYNTFFRKTPLGFIL